MRVKESGSGGSNDESHAPIQEGISRLWTREDGTPQAEGMSGPPTMAMSIPSQGRTGVSSHIHDAYHELPPTPGSSADLPQVVVSQVDGRGVFADAGRYR